MSSLSDNIPAYLSLSFAEKKVIILDLCHTLMRDEPDDIYRHIWTTLPDLSEETLDPQVLDGIYRAIIEATESVVESTQRAAIVDLQSHADTLHQMAIREAREKETESTQASDLLSLI